jgi:hypothetical protein
MANMKMQKVSVITLLVAMPMLVSISAQADVISDRLAQYRAEGAGDFVANQGGVCGLQITKAAVVRNVMVRY